MTNKTDTKTIKKLAKKHADQFNETGQRKHTEPPVNKDLLKVYRSEFNRLTKRN